MSACPTGQKPLCESKLILEEALPHLVELGQRTYRQSLSFENET